MLQTLASCEETKDEREALLNLHSQCKLLTTVFKLASQLQTENEDEMSIDEIERLERQIIYRSNSLNKLQEAIEIGYRHAPQSPGDFALRRLDQVLREEDLLGLYCLILKKRLLIIDDLEFVGKRKTFRHSFLTLDQIWSTAQLLNLIAYCVFQTGNKRDKFSTFFLENLQGALSSLVSRDHRLRLLPSDFWVVDKHMAAKTENLGYQELSSVVN